MVYLVDDDVDDLELFQEALQENSYTGPVTTLTNGKILLDRLILDEKRPDVIVLDLNMPIKDGFQALEEIRSYPHLRSIPVVILTSSGKPEDEMRCMALGCNSYHTKPSTILEYGLVVNTVKKFVRA
jgi:CheY-like chemotaxis protein